MDLKIPGARWSGGGCWTIAVGVCLLLVQPSCSSGDSAEEGFSGGGSTTIEGGPPTGGGTGGSGAYGGYVSGGGGHAGGDGSVPKLGPPYPIVLAHGFFGFDQFAGFDAVTYFYQVRDHLATKGETNVFTPAVDPFNDSTTRGAELLIAIENVLLQTGHAKVNVIGHSQGGLDARVVASDRPDLVASVTTIAAPHAGTPIADVVTGAVSDPKTQELVDWLVKSIGYELWDASGKKTSLWKPLELLSKPGIEAFNQKYTDRAGVLYWSLTGRSDWKLAEMECKPDQGVAFIDKWKSETDPVETLLAPTEAYLSGGLTQPYANDGLVRVKDARWGTVLGCIPADHFDEIGQLFGDSPGLGNGFEHKELYADLVAFLRAQGL